MRVEILSCSNECFDLLHNGTANSELVVGSMVLGCGWLYGCLLEVKRNTRHNQNKRFFFVMVIVVL